MNEGERAPMPQNFPTTQQWTKPQPGQVHAGGEEGPPVRVVLDAGKLPIPVDVVDAAHRLSVRAHSGEEVELLSGAYWLRARLPAGAALDWRFELKASDTTVQWILRHPDDSVVARMVDRKKEPVVLLRLRLPVVFPARALPPESSGSAEDAAEPVAERAPWLRQAGREEVDDPSAIASVRFVTVEADGEVRETTGPVVDDIEPLGAFTSRLTVSIAGTVLRAPDQEIARPPGAVSGRVTFAQVRLREDEGPLTVALPLADARESRRCWLYVSTHAGRLHVRAEALKESSEVLREYVATGSADEAAGMHGPLFAGLAEDPADDPIGAVLAAHALMYVDAFRDPKRPDLLSWLERVWDAAQWLPDLHALRGELCFRRGDHVTAIVSFLQAARRGMPLFVDSLSYAVARLRTYRHSGQLAKLDRPQTRLRAERVGRRLQQLARYVDASPVYMNLRDGYAAESSPGVGGPWVPVPLVIERRLSRD